MIYFLGSILALLPIYRWRFEILGLPTTFLELLIVVFLAMVFISKYHELGSLKKHQRLNWFVLAFVLAGIISTLVSPEPVKALGLLKAFIIEPVLLFYAAVLVIKNTKNLRLPLLCLFWSAVAVSVFGLIQSVTLIGLPLRFWGTGAEPLRIVSVFEYPNALALYLGPLFIFFFALALKKNLLSTYPHFAGLAVMGLALLLTQSRGAWLAVFAGLIFLAFKNFHWKKALSGTLLVLFVLLLLAPVRNRIGLVAQDPSSTAHLDLMQIGIHKIISNPIFGNGLFGFRNTLEQAGYRGELLNYPHNIFLNLWLELGLLGFIAFFAVLWFVLDRYKKQPGVFSLAVASFMLVVLIHGLVDAPYFKNDLAVLFWFMVSVSTLKNSQ
ncbi:MAG: O-antigen ligase family protein [Candidatus Doudnabacteria bacterium]|nr:O-antigen ligase family protein [Candidatus Doudnabacteria bacterium]